MYQNALKNKIVVLREKDGNKPIGHYTLGYNTEVAALVEDCKLNNNQYVLDIHIISGNLDQLEIALKQQGHFISRLGYKQVTLTKEYVDLLIYTMYISSAIFPEVKLNQILTENEWLNQSLANDDKKIVLNKDRTYSIVSNK